MCVCVQAYLRDIADLVLDHCNKVNITIWIFWLPIAYENYFLYTSEVWSEEMLLEKC